MKLLVASLLVFFGTLIAAALVALGEPGESLLWIDGSVPARGVPDGFLQLGLAGLEWR